MHEPTDVGGELLRFGARQNHAKVERMQEPALGDPALGIDQVAMHDRDLSRRTAEADAAQLEPIANGFSACRCRRRAQGGSDQSGEQLHIHHIANRAIAGGRRQHDEAIRA